MQGFGFEHIVVFTPLIRLPFVEIRYHDGGKKRSNYVEPGYTNSVYRVTTRYGKLKALFQAPVQLASTVL